MSSDAEILSPRAGASTGEAGSADPRRWAALVVMLLAAFMNLLDVSIVNIAIPPIQHGLHARAAGPTRSQPADHIRLRVRTPNTRGNVMTTEENR